MCPCPKGAPPVAAPESTPEAPAKRKRGRPKGTVSPWLKRVQEERAAPPAVVQTDQALDDPERTAALVRLMKSLQARDNFAEFCKQAWHVVEPGTDLEWNWHHQLICNVLQALFESWQKGKYDHAYLMPVVNTVFSVAPGSLKSRLIMVFFMAWCWLHAPSMKFICLSVNEDATMRDARACRDLIKSAWYQGSFSPDWKLKGDQDAISNYGNTSGGERLSKPSGSEIVGLRGDCVDGETLVATERGDIPIAMLHAMPAAQRPRAWSVDHATGQMVLSRILGTRRIADRPVVEVRTEADNTLRCTRDHRIYVEGEYVPAQDAAGREVSILRRTRDEVVQESNATALREVPLRDADVRGVYGAVPATGRRVRQEEGAWADGRPVLLEDVQDARGESTSDLEMVREVLASFSPALSEAEQDVLLARVLRSGAEGAPGDVRLRVSGMPPHGALDQQATDVLRSNVRRSSALGAHDGFGKLELQGARSEPVRGRLVDESRADDSRARRLSVHGLRDAEELPRDAGAPYRRGPGEQCAGEPDHALRFVSCGAPPVVETTRASVHECVVDGRQETVDVYDLHVEGTHNFFAGGVLVHNCTLYDDPNAPDEQPTDREKINYVWDTSIYSRVNSMTRSFRVGVQQRVADGDWTSHVLENQGAWTPENRYGWLNVVLPAEYEPERKFILPEVLANVLRAKLPASELVLEDPRTREGASVHEARFTEDMLKAEKARWEGTGNYAAQYQQRPALAEGGAIKRKWFSWCLLDGGVRPEFDAWRLEGDRRPRPPDTDHEEKAMIIPQKHHRPGYWDFDWIDISIDCAAKETVRGSQWAMIVVAGKGVRRFVLDDRTQRGDILVIIQVLKDMVKLWRPDSILIEDKAAGVDLKGRLLIEMSKGEMSVVRLDDAKTGNRGKSERLDACKPVLANRFVHLLDGAPWVTNFVEELAMFPNGRYDDRVDALSQVLNHHMPEEAAENSLPDW